MPMFDYKCPKCGWQDEEFFHQRETPFESVVCAHCGSEAERQLPMMADTKTLWGDSHARFDRGLGCVVKNTHHREQLCKDRGLVPLDAMPNHYVEDRNERERSKSSAQQAVGDTYSSALVKFDGDSHRAAVEAMPASACLDGSLEHTFRETI